MKGINEPPPELPLAHHFADRGIYVREMLMPAGTIVMGKIHRFSTVNIIHGMVQFVNPEQGEYEGKTVVGPYTFVSPAGTKRCIAAVTDSIWMTVHHAETQDLDEIESIMIADSYEDLE